jgi:uncharacterized membrane protein
MKFKKYNMEFEKIIQTLIYIHAAFGGIALLAGGVALIVKKGKNVHKKSGLLFYYAMLTSALMAFIISILPDHENPFLFSIGIFSTYFLISGYRSLNFKNIHFNLKIDKIISLIILITGATMILYPLIFQGKIYIVLLIFGFIGLVFGIKDLIAFKNKANLKKNWLKLHLGKMTGGYIAAVSAFFVVNNILPGVWNWFTPGVIGSVFITIWMSKVKFFSK